MLRKPLRTTDIILAVVFFVNSILIFIKYGTNAFGQVLFNIILGLIMIIMTFTSTRPDDIPLQNLTVYYFTRISLMFLMLVAGIILLSELVDGIKRLLGL
jgi:hypothetical protein